MKRAETNRAQRHLKREIVIASTRLTSIHAGFDISYVPIRTTVTLRRAKVVLGSGGRLLSFEFSDFLFMLDRLVPLIRDGPFSRGHP
jgi:hypothetical protein